MVGTAGNVRVAELAAAVARRRKELGLLQADLATLAGCSQRFVHTVEHAKESLRLDKLLDVLEVLGIDLVIGPGSGRVSGTGAAAASERATDGPATGGRAASERGTGGRAAGGRAASERAAGERATAERATSARTTA